MPLNYEEVKEHYNNQTDDYNFYRWHDIPGTTYQQTYRAIEHHIAPLIYEKVLEVGCGAGAFSLLPLKYRENVHIDALDISAGMIKQAKQNLGQRENINYIVGQVKHIDTPHQHDLIYSVRCVEYYPDKWMFFQTTARLCRRGTHYVIVTKNPYSIGRIVCRMLGKRHYKIHDDYLSPGKAKWFAMNHYIDVQLYPCTVRVPFLGKRLSNALWRHWHKKPLTAFRSLFTESYIVVGQKQ